MLSEFKKMKSYENSHRGQIKTVWMTVTPFSIRLIINRLILAK